MYTYSTRDLNTDILLRDVLIRSASAIDLSWHVQINIIQKGPIYAITFCFFFFHRNGNTSVQIILQDPFQNKWLKTMVLFSFLSSKRFGAAPLYIQRCVNDVLCFASVFLKILKLRLYIIIIITVNRLHTVYKLFTEDFLLVPFGPFT